MYETLADLADAIGISPFLLARYAYASERFYKSFRIAKRNSRGSRKITAPSAELKGIQRWVLYEILRKFEVHPASTAFRPKCSILKNAQMHCSRDFVLNLDLQDFYPSICAARVFGLYRSLDFSDETASVLTRLTTYKNTLPQGTPTSPDIANLICRTLDSRLFGYCKNANWSYTRYCDDITISGNGGITEAVLSRVSEIIQDEGFQINHGKTRVSRKSSRQIVTGLVVNVKPSVPIPSRKRIRGLCKQAELYPAEYAHLRSKILGDAAFLGMVRPDDPLLAEKGVVTRALAKLAERS